MGDIRFPSRDQPPGASLGEPAEQDAKAWSGEKDRAVRSRQVQSYGPRGIPVTVRRARRAADALSFE
jgi:hypothetical protein